MQSRQTNRAREFRVKNTQNHTLENGSKIQMRGLIRQSAQTIPYRTSHEDMVTGHKKDEVRTKESYGGPLLTENMKIQQNDGLFHTVVLPVRIRTLNMKNCLVFILSFYG
jgi:hypothetical protein